MRHDELGKGTASTTPVESRVPVCELSGRQSRRRPSLVEAALPDGLSFRSAALESDFETCWSRTQDQQVARWLSALLAAAAAAGLRQVGGLVQLWCLGACISVGLAIVAVAALLAARRPQSRRGSYAVAAAAAAGESWARRKAKGATLVWVATMATMLLCSCRSLASGLLSDHALTAAMSLVMLPGRLTPRIGPAVLATLGYGCAATASALVGGTKPCSLALLCIVCLTLHSQVQACRAAKTLYLQELRMASKAYHFYVLLAGMLPPPLVRRYFDHCLGIEGAADATDIRVCMGERVSECGVLFLAIHDFDRLAAEGSQHAIVLFLNRFFSRLDTACADAVPEVMKMGNYGEIYVAACGRFLDDQDDEDDEEERDCEEAGGATQRLSGQMAALARLARQAHDLASEFPVQLRAGLHCGPVVAGIVGDRLPRFQVLGDTVNRAARLEQSCPPGHTLLSERAAEVLRAAGFDVVRHGLLPMWGLGDIPTFRLKAPSSKRPSRSSAKGGLLSARVRFASGLNLSLDVLPDDTTRAESSDESTSGGGDCSRSFSLKDMDTSTSPLRTPTTPKTPTAWLAVESQLGFGIGYKCLSRDYGDSSGDEADNIESLPTSPVALGDGKPFPTTCAEREGTRAVSQLRQALQQREGKLLGSRGGPASRAAFLQAQADSTLEVTSSPVFAVIAAVLLLSLRLQAPAAGDLTKTEAAVIVWGAFAAGPASRQAARTFGARAAAHLTAVVISAGCCWTTRCWTARFEPSSGGPALMLAPWAWLALGASARVPLSCAAAACVAGVAAATAAGCLGPALATLALVALRWADHRVESQRCLVQELALHAQERMRAAAEAVVPPFVVSELRMARFGAAGRRPSVCVSHAYALVTVLETDIAGFTSFSHTRPPEEVLRLLDSIFGVFDGMAKERGVYKMDTIGDAYICVSGLPDFNGGAHSASLMLLVAAEFVAAVARFSEQHALPQSIGLRAGLNSGPCVGGVVGTAMQRYHLFGQTMRVAEVLEATAPRNGVQLSRATWSEHARELGSGELPEHVFQAAKGLRFQERDHSKGLVTSKGEVVTPDEVGGLSTFLMTPGDGQTAGTAS